jgi:uncharacterized integral membrane protein (TIGR00697 family)
MSVLDHKGNRLFLVLGAFFLTNALLAEFIGGKIFSLEGTLGITDWQFTLFGQEIQGMNLTAGVILWPFVFVMTDVINEYFGFRGVRFLSWLAVVLILYAFVMVYAAMGLVPASFWGSRGFTDDPAVMDAAYGAVFGQGLWIIAGSVVAFLIGQLVDVTVFQYLRRLTGARAIWLRATGSTLVSQLIDSFVVLYIAFGLNPATAWPWPLLLAVATVNYCYKFFMAIALTPLLYVLHWGIDRYLGAELAQQLQDRAAGLPGTPEAS